MLYHLLFIIFHEQLLCPMFNDGWFSMLILAQSYVALGAISAA